MIQLEMINVAVAYGGRQVVSGVSFLLRAGEIGCLLGPSGCGKTTLLRAIAGFELLSRGEVRLQGSSVSRPGTAVPPERRKVGMVFQDLALYPHLTVEQNIAFGLRKLSLQERRQRVDELLRLVALEAERSSYPHELSGGQQQRVALVRAMAPRPQILLLDEPFSGLDMELREQLAREVRALLQRDGITAVLVTHDQLEAFAMADCIGVLGEGRLHQWASSYDLYHQPADRFVADFIGQGSLVKGRVLSERRIKTPLGVVAPRHAHALRPGGIVQVLLRPDALCHDADSPFALKITDRVFRGAQYLCTLRLPDGGEVLCLVSSHHNCTVGQRIGIRLNTDQAVVFSD